MSYPIKYPTPQGANIQIFNAADTTTLNNFTKTWIKPQGASFVWFTLIGSGGAGDTVTPQGGGSGAVTNCLVPAFLIPDILRIQIGKGGINGVTSSSPTLVNYIAKSGTGYTLLRADGGFGGTDGTSIGGPAFSSNYFSAMGFFQSVAGQDGWPSNGTGASATTFLSGGVDSTTSTANYGYSTYVGDGFFQMQPIIVSASNALSVYKTGIGSGGASNGTDGGDGMVIIITW
jgi:hypothetical protein